MTTYTDRELLAEARQVIAEQSEMLERLSQAALPYGVIVGKDEVNKTKKLILATGNGYISIADSGHKLGDTVLLEPMTNQAFATGHFPLVGNIHEVAAINEYGAVISLHGDDRIVAIGNLAVKKNDRVLLDPTGNVIIAVVQEARPAYMPNVEHVGWDDIGGQEEAKRRLIEAVELPYLHPKIYAAYDKKPAKGILLKGPPGCGKTLLAKAVATSIGSTGGFIACKGPEILDPYVGVAERNVRNLFRKAEAWKAENGKPAVVFIDEAEAILSARGGRHSYMEKTIVPTFLTEMDGLETSAAIVILATNRDDLLDPAVIRDGRIDYKVDVTRPSAVDAIQIMDIHVGKKPMQGNRKRTIDGAVSNLYMVPDLPFSGALISGMVEKAVDHAILRDIAAKKTTGLCDGDFAHAANIVKQQELAYAA